MSADLKIFHDFTNLSFLEVKVDEYPILNGDLMTLQIDQSFNVGGVVAKLEFKDTFDIFNNSVTTINNDNTVSISFKDFSEKSYVRTFKIKDISHRKYNERFRIVSLTLIDAITMKLSQTHIDKYIKGDTAQAIKALITEVCGTEISKDLMSIDAIGNEESATGNMLCNSSQNCLEFIRSKLSKYNLRMFQTRNKIYIKELKPSTLTSFEYKFTDKVMNNKYIYKIHDREQFTSNNIGTPKTTNYRITGKSVNTNTKNFEDVKGDLILNTNNSVDTSKLQGQSGKMITQAASTEGQQKMKLFDSYMNSNRMQLAVCGTVESGNIDTVIDVEFSGLVGFSDLTTEGDTMNSGKYYIVGVSDLIIGMKYIQRLTLSRAENLQPRDLS